MTPAVTIREFVMSDYDHAVALWDRIDGVEICEGDSREEISEYLKRNPGLSRVAEANGAIIGAALCGHDGRRGWIYHLAVAPEYRGRGAGKLLLADCVRGLREAGLKRAIILVAGDNPTGHKFWLREGWENIDGAIAMTKEFCPALVLMDIGMPLLNGLEATRQILKALPATKVLMLSVHGEDAYVEEAVSSGAMGYLIKQTSADSVCSAIREVQKGNTYFSPSIPRRLHKRNRKK